MKAAKTFATQLAGLGFESKVISIKNNEWLAKVETSLGNFAVYTNSKGKVSIQTHFIPEGKQRDKAHWALDVINAQATVPAVDDDTWIAYTDGSAQHGQCGWSMVLFNPKGNKDYEKAGNLGPQANGQIAGEVEGAICVLQDAVSKGVKKLILRHDYEGVGKWGSGAWKNKDGDATRLKQWCQYAKLKGVEVAFQWTRGHNGDAGNERADVLASKATLAKPVKRIKNPPLKEMVKSTLKQEDLNLSL